MQQNNEVPDDLLLPCNGTAVQRCDFEAGDVRVMEQPGLTSMHTIFQRLHNVFEKQIHRFNDHLSGEELYQVNRS